LPYLQVYIYSIHKSEKMKYFEETKKLLGKSNYYYIIAIDMQGTYTYVNSHYNRAFSPNESIIGKSYETTMHPDDMKICEEVAAKCFANPDDLFPASIRKHDGKGGYVFTQWEYKAMYDKHGNPSGIFCLGNDITQFVAESQQRQLAETEIEKKVLKLKEIAFQHSHLIRAPLSNILGLAQLLENSAIDNSTANICKMILESSTQLDNVIRNIVDTTQPENGELEESIV